MSCIILHTCVIWMSQCHIICIVNSVGGLIDRTVNENKSDLAKARIRCPTT